MSDMVVLGQGKADMGSETLNSSFPSAEKKHIPSMRSLETRLMESGKLVDDLVLKKYLHRLSELEIVPLSEELKNISAIRMFRITEMIYQRKEFSTHKFSSVFSAVQHLGCGVFIVLDSDGEKTDVYLGVRSFDDMRTTKSLKDTLRNALNGQFPGVQTCDLLDVEATEVLSEIAYKNIASVSCVAKSKSEDIVEDEIFVQGLEKLALAMQGQKYTAVVLAKGTSSEQLEELRQAYEMIYTNLSPFSNIQVSYGQNVALSVSDAFSRGRTEGTSHSVSASHSTSTSRSENTTRTESTNTSVSQTKDSWKKGLGKAALGIASVITAPMTGGASIAVAGAITAGGIALDSYQPKTETYGSSSSVSTSDTLTTGNSETHGKTEASNQSTSQTRTKTEGETRGSSETIQLPIQNKALFNTLERIDKQLERLDECESLGMWECAAYFLSDNQETTEMAAGLYKALMRGENSGVETSDINLWGRDQKEKLPLLKDYITNFIHPVFAYTSETVSVPVTPASLVSSNELALHMGLPRKSFPGFPVIEHAEFGKEVVRYGFNEESRPIRLGKIFNMGRETKTEVRLDADSLTMHTFITGSTGSGKSNTVYEILNKLRSHKIPFLVIEPAKGEYKNVFGQYPNVSVYGTNPKKSPLLRINPFRFPAGVHVLEHMDRLVEIFNVCWPMYAAMPAILKEGLERAYIAVGWNLSSSENERGEGYPSFVDLLEQTENVIRESKYSEDSKGDYAGALLTRLRSLTNGINGLIFTNQDLADEELFDENVLVDLSRVGSMETKALLMGLLVMKLNEYRMSSEEMNRALSHVTVLEEAHHLLKRTSAEQSAESANLLGKSVELLANSIAEMRTYGEGFIIADQSPGLMDLSAIRNTNTKIILRLPDKTDRELVGYAAGLSDLQIEELSKLKKGVAAVYQNDWVEPVLVQIDKSPIEEKRYEYRPSETELTDVAKLQKQAVRFLIQGRVKEKLDFSASEIRQGLYSLPVSYENREFIENALKEYERTQQMTAWQDKNFGRLAQKVTDFSGVRDQVEELVLRSSDEQELTDGLRKTAERFFDNPSEAAVFALAQCYMKDMSLGLSEREMREKIYRNWEDSVRARRVNL